MQRTSHQGYRGRVRSGCLTCRSRKVKCDEARPVCNNCTRLQRHCTYKSRKVSRLIVTAQDTALNQSSHLNGIAPASETGTHDSSQPHPSPPLTDDRELQGTIKTSASVRANQTPILYQGSTDVDLTACLENALQGRRVVSPTQDDDYHESNDSPSNLISRDIELTTTIDILTLRTESPHMTALFLEGVDCPGISPFDRVNWQLAKHHIVHLGRSCPTIASCVTAVSALYKAHRFALPLSGCMSHYQSAKRHAEDLLNDQSNHFNLALVSAFLLCMFELIHSGDIAPHLKEPSPSFIRSLEAWAQNPSSHSELDIRIITWLKILHSTTIRGGAFGLLTERVASLFPDYGDSIPNVKAPPGYEPDISNHMYEVLSGPIFNFYFRLQILSGEIAKLTLYHRSRTKSTDQEEVVERMTHLKTRLHALWESRCATQRQSPKILRSQLVPKIANKIISLISICDAAYHAEFVEIGRQLGDPVSKSPDSRDALYRIKEIVESDPNHDCDDNRRGIDPGYLRPLFLYAIENTDDEQTRWAVEKIAQIQNSIYRGEFFSEFAKALSESQARNDRRVTSRYFCIWYFGVTPPYM
ncbi:hypothetical protein BGZ63DRAFT_405438 [Mariannaea sp. PMI_226]|nr:hypothetical protein BGZ63DRAFT_405438 [Mariannaea sp. PMI_226]